MTTRTKGQKKENKNESMTNSYKIYYLQTIIKHKSKLFLIFYGLVLK